MSLQVNGNACWKLELQLFFQLLLAKPKNFKSSISYKSNHIVVNLDIFHLSSNIEAHEESNSLESGSTNFHKTYFNLLPIAIEDCNT